MNDGVMTVGVFSLIDTCVQCSVHVDVSALVL